MGCASSKINKNDTRPSYIHTSIPPDEDLYVHSDDDEDSMRIALLKRDYKEDMETFLLNNLLMSVMFFENYEREMKKVANTISKKEKEMSLKLMKDHKKQCIMPDIVFENVNQMVRFRKQYGPRPHGPISDDDYPLITQRMFIVHDTIEALNETEDLGHYSGIDKPTCRVNIIESKHAGYVNLKQVDYMNLDNENRKLSSNSTTFDEGSFIAYAKGKAVIKSEDQGRCMLPPYCNPGPSTSHYDTSVADSSLEDYDYISINEARTQRPISISENNRNNSGGLPPHCIKEVKVKNIITDEKDDELYKIHRYIDSGDFMCYFRDNVFPGTLGQALGFSPGEIFESKYNSGAIYCNTSDDIGCVVTCEIIPAVLNPWPNLELWRHRSRPIVIDRRTTTMYVWPTTLMIDEIFKMHAVVIPRGYLPKRGVNPEINLEWEIGFPKAEKFMHARMSHAQTRCFLFILLLFKTFIEPITGEKGILVDHLRIAMFWECERNFKDWPEDRLGVKLIKVLRNLFDCLGKRYLKDYFIVNKNVFENIPGNFLLKAQEKIHNITEAPVMHFICALMNLEYSLGFYPGMDFKVLYKMLHAKNAVKLFNPELAKQCEADGQQMKNKTKLNPEQQWEKRKLEQMLRRKQEEKNKLKKPEEIPNLNHKRKDSKDFIDLHWTSHKKIEDLKGVQIVQFFVDHFIKIAERSTKYANNKQALFYLKQAWYLTHVLQDLSSGEINLSEYQARIKNLEETYTRQSTMEPVTPNIPARNSMQVIKETPSTSRGSMRIPKERILKTKVIDMKNVDQAFQKGIRTESPKLRKDQSSVNRGNWVENNVMRSESSAKVDRKKVARRNTNAKKVGFAEVQSG